MYKKKGGEIILIFFNKNIPTEESDTFDGSPSLEKQDNKRQFTP